MSARSDLSSKFGEAWSAGKDRLRVVGEPVDIWRAFYDLGWVDGLPIIPPTAEAVIKLLTESDLESVYGPIPPSNQELTADLLAVNAAMSGCDPEMLPGIVAAIKAILAPPFNLAGVQTTTSATAPVFVYNGAFPQAVGMEVGNDALGASSRVNAGIGRAVRLILRNIGGARPPGIDKATIGNPLKVTAALAENESQSPWPPLSTRRGLAGEESVVTAFACTGFVEVRDSDSTSAEGILRMMALAMRTGAWIACNNSGDRLPEALVAFYTGACSRARACRLRSSVGRGASVG